VGLGSKMHHNVVVATYQFVDQTGVTNIALYQSKATLRQTLEGLAVSGGRSACATQ
jgi:hypothetical protein